MNIRGAELTLKMFLADNLSVVDRDPKFKVSFGAATGTLQGAMLADWHDAQTVWQVKYPVVMIVYLITCVQCVEGVFGYAVNLFQVRQMDYSG